MIFWTVRQARHELAEDQPPPGVIYQKCYKNARRNALISPGDAIPDQQKPHHPT